MLLIKKGVSVRGLRTEILLALMIAEQTFDVLPCRLTEGTGGKHKAGSLHYVGLAVDIGIKDYSGNLINAEHLDTLVKKLRERLSEEYDVVLEVDHIHLEFQPK